MPVISVGRDKLFKALGREYSELLLYQLLHVRGMRVHATLTCGVLVRPERCIVCCPPHALLFFACCDQVKRNSRLYVSTMASSWMMW